MQFFAILRISRNNCEAKAKRTLKVFLRSEANSLRFRNKANSQCEFEALVRVKVMRGPSFTYSCALVSKLGENIYKVALGRCASSYKDLGFYENTHSNN